MNTLPLKDIHVPPSRQRTFFDPVFVSDLAKSISEDGLLNAVVLCEREGQPPFLVAGFTRFKAIESLHAHGTEFYYDGQVVPAGRIPYTVAASNDPISIFRAELRENLLRKQLSPIDEAKALATLARMVQDAKPSPLPGLPSNPVTMGEVATALAELTGQSSPSDQQRIADAIMIDKMKDHPDVKRAKTIGEAARLARKAAERSFRETLGGMQIASAPTRHTVIQGDCADVLPTIVGASVDVIIADPPYGIGADSFGEQSLVGHEYKDDDDAWLKVIEAVVVNAGRICKPDAALFIFLDISKFDITKFNIENNAFNDPSLDETWYIWPTPLIWHKPNRGHAPQPKRGPSRRYEAILLAIRGNREVRKVGTDVLTFNVPDDRAHGAGKPPELYQELLSWYAFPGDTVLDPCAGSGVVIPACDELDCSAIAIERDAGHVTLIKEQIK